MEATMMPHPKHTNSTAALTSLHSQRQASKCATTSSNLQDRAPMLVQAPLQVSGKVQDHSVVPPHSPTARTAGSPSPPRQAFKWAIPLPQAEDRVRRSPRRSLWSPRAPIGLATPGPASPTASGSAWQSPPLSPNNSLSPRRATFVQTPPCSPRTRPTTPPCNHFLSKSLLQVAIQSDNVVLAAAVLDDDPSAACRPMFGLEPVALGAVQIGCSGEMLKILLFQGVDANERSKNGISALEALAGASQIAPAKDHVIGFSWAFDKCRLDPITLDHAIMMTEAACMDCAAWLLAFGADRRCSQREGLTCADLAAENGMPQLAAFIKHWDGLQVRAFRSCSKMRAFPTGVFKIICNHLAPLPTNLHK
mmetsp:Transcript_14230/g.36787  ORF Transcript_14230/g.36787 Transcript_14230/m.36787 type:complete len:364 (-) Transcript_14230:307-1398(-)